ncbi:MAG: hypothetical protein ACPL1F_00015, partial [bacterium]
KELLEKTNSYFKNLLNNLENFKEKPIELLNKNLQETQKEIKQPTTTLVSPKDITNKKTKEKSQKVKDNTQKIVNKEKELQDTLKENLNNLNKELQDTEKNIEEAEKEKSETNKRPNSILRKIFKLKTDLLLIGLNHFIKNYFKKIEELRNQNLESQEKLLSLIDKVNETDKQLIQEYIEKYTDFEQDLEEKLQEIKQKYSTKLSQITPAKNYLEYLEILKEFKKLRIDIQNNFNDYIKTLRKNLIENQQLLTTTQNKIKKEEQKIIKEKEKETIEKIKKEKLEAKEIDKLITEINKEVDKIIKEQQENNLKEQKKYIEEEKKKQEEIKRLQEEKGRILKQEYKDIITFLEKKTLIPTFRTPYSDIKGIIPLNTIEKVLSSFKFPFPSKKLFELFKRLENIINSIIITKIKETENKINQFKTEKGETLIPINELEEIKEFYTKIQKQFQNLFSNISEEEIDINKIRELKAKYTDLELPLDLIKEIGTATEGVISEFLQEYSTEIPKLFKKEIIPFQLPLEKDLGNISKEYRNIVEKLGSKGIDKAIRDLKEKGQQHLKAIEFFIRKLNLPFKTTEALVKKFERETKEDIEREIGKFKAKELFATFRELGLVNIPKGIKEIIDTISNQVVRIISKGFNINQILQQNPKALKIIEERLPDFTKKLPDISKYVNSFTQLVEPIKDIEDLNEKLKLLDDTYNNLSQDIANFGKTWEDYQNLIETNINLTNDERQELEKLNLEEYNDELIKVGITLEEYKRSLTEYKELLEKSNKTEKETKEQLQKRINTFLQVDEQYTRTIRGLSIVLVDVLKFSRNLDVFAFKFYFFAESLNRIFQSFSQHVNNAIQVLRNFVEESNNLLLIQKRLESLYSSLNNTLSLGKSIFKDLTQLAVRTVFNIEDLSKAFSQFKAIGIDSFQTFNLAIDTATAFGIEISEISDDIARAIEGDTTAYKNLRHTIGLTNIEIKKLGGVLDTSGRLFNRTEEAIRNNAQALIQYLAKYSGIAEKSLGTLGQVLKNFEDGLILLKIRILESLDPLKELISNFTTFLFKLSESKTFITTLQTLTITITQLLFALKAVITVLTPLVNSIIVLANLVNILNSTIIGLVLIISNFQEINNFLSAFGINLKNYEKTFQSFFKLISKFIGQLGLLPTILDTIKINIIFESLTNNINKTTNAFQKFITFLTTSPFIKGIKDFIYNFLILFGFIKKSNNLKSIGNNSQNLFTSIINFFKNIPSNFKNFFISLFSFIANLVKNIPSFFKNFFGILFSFIGNLPKNIIPFFKNLINLTFLWGRRLLGIGLIISVLLPLLKPVLGLVLNVFNYIVEFLTWVVKILFKIFDLLPKAFERILRMINSIPGVGLLFKGISTIITFILKGIENLEKGIENTINRISEALDSDLIDDFFNKIKNNFKDTIKLTQEEIDATTGWNETLLESTNNLKELFKQIEDFTKGSKKAFFNVNLKIFLMDKIKDTTTALEQIEETFKLLTSNFFKINIKDILEKKLGDFEQQAFQSNEVAKNFISIYNKTLLDTLDNTLKEIAIKDINDLKDKFDNFEKIAVENLKKDLEKREDISNELKQKLIEYYQTVLNNIKDTLLNSPELKNTIEIYRKFLRKVIESTIEEITANLNREKFKRINQALNSLIEPKTIKEIEDMLDKVEQERLANLEKYKEILEERIILELQYQKILKGENNILQEQTKQLKNLITNKQVKPKEYNISPKHEITQTEKIKNIEQQNLNTQKQKNKELEKQKNTLKEIFDLNYQIKTKTLIPPQILKEDLIKISKIYSKTPIVIKIITQIDEEEYKNTLRKIKEIQIQKIKENFSKENIKNFILSAEKVSNKLNQNKIESLKQENELLRNNLIELYKDAILKQNTLNTLKYSIYALEQQHAKQEDILTIQQQLNKTQEEYNELLNLISTYQNKIYNNLTEIHNLQKEEINKELDKLKAIKLDKLNQEFQITQNIIKLHNLKFENLKKETLQNEEIIKYLQKQNKIEENNLKIVNNFLEKINQIDNKTKNSKTFDITIQTNKFEDKVKKVNDLLDKPEQLSKKRKEYKIKITEEPKIKTLTEQFKELNQNMLKQKDVSDDIVDLKEKEIRLQFLIQKQEERLLQLQEQKIKKLYEYQTLYFRFAQRGIPENLLKKGLPFDLDKLEDKTTKNLALREARISKFETALDNLMDDINNGLVSLDKLNNLSYLFYDTIKKSGIDLSKLSEQERKIFEEELLTKFLTKVNDNIVNFSNIIIKYFNLETQKTKDINTIFKKLDESIQKIKNNLSLTKPEQEKAINELLKNFSDKTKSTFENLLKNSYTINSILFKYSDFLTQFEFNLEQNKTLTKEQKEKLRKIFQEQLPEFQNLIKDKLISVIETYPIETLEEANILQTNVLNEIDRISRETGRDFRDIKETLKQYFTEKEANIIQNNLNKIADKFKDITNTIKELKRKGIDITTKLKITLPKNEIEEIFNKLDTTRDKINDDIDTLKDYIKTYLEGIDNVFLRQKEFFRIQKELAAKGITIKIEEIFGEKLKNLIELNKSLKDFKKGVDDFINSIKKQKEEKEISDLPDWAKEQIKDLLNLQESIKKQQEELSKMTKLQTEEPQLYYLLQKQLEELNKNIESQIENIKFSTKPFTLKGIQIGPLEELGMKTTQKSFFESATLALTDKVATTLQNISSILQTKIQQTESEIFKTAVDNFGNHVKDFGNYVKQLQQKAQELQNQQQQDIPEYLKNFTSPIYFNQLLGI